MSNISPTLPLESRLCLVNSKSMILEVDGTKKKGIFNLGIYF